MSEEQRPSFGRKAIASINKRLPTLATEEVGPGMGPPDELISYTVPISRGLYLRLLQAKFWVRGLKLQDVVADALDAELQKLGPEAAQPLPPAQLAEQVRKNKKLQAGNK